MTFGVILSLLLLLSPALKVDVTGSDQFIFTMGVIGHKVELSCIEYQCFASNELFCSELLLLLMLID